MVNFCAAPDRPARSHTLSRICDDLQVSFDQNGEVVMVGMKLPNPARRLASYPLISARSKPGD